MADRDSDFSSFLSGFLVGGLVGAAVAVDHKQAAINFVDQKSISFRVNLLRSS